MNIESPATPLQHPSKLGAALAVILLQVAFLLPQQMGVQFAAITLAVTGGAYAGFALQDARAPLLWVEMAGALAFTAAALAGLWLTPFAIPAAYAAHAVWDVLHHRGKIIATGVPAWYIPFCAVFDLVTAGGLIVLWR